MKCSNPLGIVPRGTIAANRELINGQFVYSDGKEYWNESEVRLVPCGKCVWCREQNAMQWSFRCQLEAKYWKESCVLTLTYAVSPRSVVKRDIQLFIKRLRKALEPDKISYFCAAEYGSQFKRPHYHMIVFGYSPDDAVFVFTKNGKNYYRSDFIDKLWNYQGMVTIDLKASSEAIGYVVGYTLGKCFMEVPKGCEQPFSLMSRRPAIGKKYLDDNMDLIYEHDKVYVNGKAVRPPKYFDRKFEECVPREIYEKLKLKRSSQIDDSMSRQDFEDQSRYRAKRKFDEWRDSRKSFI